MLPYLLPLILVLAFLFYQCHEWDSDKRIMRGQKIAASEAKQLGIVNKVVSLNELKDTTIKLAQQIIKLVL